MANEYQTIKVRRATYRRLKLLAVQHDETMMDCIDRLVHESDSVKNNRPDATDDARRPAATDTTAARDS
jgi:hypothetical protein